MISTGFLIAFKQSDETPIIFLIKEYLLPVDSAEHNMIDVRLAFPSGNPWHMHPLHPVLLDQLSLNSILADNIPLINRKGDKEPSPVSSGCALLFGYSAQFAVFRFFTLENSRMLFVTTV